MNEDVIKNVITAIGSLGEISATYYKTLIANEIPADAALGMSVAFVSKFVEVLFGHIHDDDDEGE